MLTRLSTRLLTVLLLATCALITGCTSQPQYPDELRAIDSLTMSRPDSALLLLSDMEPRMAHETEPVRRYYQLLTVKAQDKAFIPHNSDSLILDVLHYYEQMGDPRLLPEAYYYAGSVMRDLGDTPQALDYYHEALDAMQTDIYRESVTGGEYRSLRLQASIHAQMGYLFRQQHLYNEAINSATQACRIDSIIQDTAMMLFDLVDIGAYYRLGKNYEAAMSFYTDAEALALCKGDSTRLFYIACQLATLYEELGDYVEAGKYICKYPLRTTSLNKSTIYFILGEYYSNINQREKASVFFEYLLSSHNLPDQLNANLWLGWYANSKKDPKAFDYINRFMQLQDSSRRLDNQEVILLSQSLYNYQLREKEIQRLKIVEAKQEMRIWMSLVIALVLVLLLYIMYVRWQNSIKQYEQLQGMIGAEMQRTTFGHEKTQNALMRLTETETYKMILSKCEREQSLVKKDWQVIEAMYAENMPEFIPKLHRIYSFNETEWKITLLLKMGFEYPAISKLISLGYPSVYSSQRRLFQKVFKKDESVTSSENFVFKDWKDFVTSL